LACRREGAQGSFFLLGNLSPKFPEVVTALAENGEIGTHSMYHKSFKGRALDSQLTELTQGVRTLQSLGVDEVVGFRPPMEEYDENTLKAVAAAGFRFIYGNLNYDRAYPVARRVDGKLLYQFARIVPDDYNINVDRNARDKASYEREYLGEFRRLYQYGGLYPFSFHTNYLARRESVGVIEETIRALKQESVWMTTFGDIVDWMEARRGIEIKAKQKDGRVSIRIANRSGKPLNALSLHYFPPSDAGEVRLVGTPEEGIKIHRAPREGYVISVDLRAGEEREIWLE
jgi:peptidoglycan/xylan/chitin deacetylase (PgdA/CDA1 family)